jgi:serine/threonine protein phosphatase PrpC
MTTLLHAGLTDPGRVRDTNEDCWTADPGQGLYLVADGLGNAAAGELAARVVARALPPLLQQCLRDVEDLSSPAARQRVLLGMARLSKQLHQQAQGKAGLEGMGATVVLALVRGRHALIAHLGDSRAYLWRRGCLKQLTNDHSLVQLLLDCGQIRRDQAAGHAASGQLTRYVGMPGEALPDARVLELQAGDRLLLCSDGLSNMLGNVELLKILGRRADPAVACRQLVDAANDAGGTDNVTALVVHVVGVGA